MSQLGQSRPNGAVRTMFGLVPLATELWTSMVVWFVPISDVATSSDRLFVTSEQQAFLGSPLCIVPADPSSR